VSTEPGELQRLAEIEADFKKVETNLERALAFAGDCEAAYRQASDTVRRQFNLAFFERLLIDEDYQITSKLAQPFDTLLGDGLRQVAVAKARNEQRPQEPKPVLVGADSPTTPYEVVGWSQNNMVGPAGLEPAT
jgi:hypothetical protein